MSQALAWAALILRCFDSGSFRRRFLLPDEHHARSHMFSFYDTQLVVHASHDDVLVRTEIPLVSRSQTYGLVLAPKVLFCNQHCIHSCIGIWRFLRCGRTQSIEDLVSRQTKSRSLDEMSFAYHVFCFSICFSRQFISSEWLRVGDNWLSLHLGGVSISYSVGCCFCTGCSVAVCLYSSSRSLDRDSLGFLVSGNKKF